LRPLQAITDFEKMPSGERKGLVEQLPSRRGAARSGVSVGSFVKILFDDDGGSLSRY